MRQRQPHLIYLMADHLRGDVLGPYPSDYAQCPTPNLDQLSSGATVFENHITPCPLCCPARSSIMTGLWPHQHGALINAKPHNVTAEQYPLLPARLAAAGYRVVHAGVQHVRGPHFGAQPGVEFPFTRQQGIGGSSLDSADFRSPTLVQTPNGLKVSLNSNTQTARWPDAAEAFFDIALTEQLVASIQGHDDSRPLALFGMYWAPHPPLAVPDPWWSQFEPESLRLPPTVGVWCQGQSPLQLLHLPGQLGAGVPKRQWPRVWAAYLGLVAMLDHCIGRVCAALRAKGLFDDALIVVTSDHGEMLGCHALYQKMCLYEEAARVPFIAKFPGQTAARRVSALTNHVDVAPTFCALGGADPLPTSVGLPLQADGPVVERAYTFSEYHGNQALGYHQWMARGTRYKLIDTGEHGQELYDLESDPYETHNLWDESDAVTPAEHAALVHALAAFKRGDGDHSASA